MGLPVMEFLHAREGSAEYAVLHTVREAGSQVLDDLMTTLAQKIVREYAEAQKRGQRGSKGK
jgi:hypothetical protein